MQVDLRLIPWFMSDKELIMKSNHISGESRRTFIKKGATVAAGLAVASSAKSYASVLGANDNVSVAVIGLKRRGLPQIHSLSKIPNVVVTYVCEVDEKQMEVGLAEAEGYLGYRPKAMKDMRQIVEKSDVDAVFLAIPDHWHAYGTMIAAQNGKHVYVEKPCSHNLAEDDFLIALENKYKNLRFQMGTQQRSSLETIEVISAVHNGLIGDTYKATTFYSNARGSVPVPQEVAPPTFLDWELWQGPAPRRKYLHILEDYNWHWRWHWGTAESANNGTHELDVARWALDVNYPEQVQTQCGKFHYADDGWEMYDTMMVTFKFPGNKVLHWDGKSRNGYQSYGAGRGSIIYGTDGSLFINRNGYKVFSRDGEILQEKKVRSEAGIALGGGGNMTTGHIRNFIESIRGNASVNAPLSIGAVSTHLAHYTNVSSRIVEQKLNIDPETGRFKDKNIMNMYWGREYESGWELNL